MPNLDEATGTKIETKVIELNRSRNNVVLSRRAVLEEERKEQRQEILDRLQPGLVVEGQISDIGAFGSFVAPNGTTGPLALPRPAWPPPALRTAGPCSFRCAPRPGAKRSTPPSRNS